ARAWKRRAQSDSARVFAKRGSDLCHRNFGVLPGVGAGLAAGGRDGEPLEVVLPTGLMESRGCCVGQATGSESDERAFVVRRGCDLDLCRLPGYGAELL